MVKVGFINHAEQKKVTNQEAKGQFFDNKAKSARNIFEIMDNINCKNEQVTKGKVCMEIFTFFLKL